MIDDGNLLDAADRAGRSARFLSGVLALDVGECVLLERNPGIATLLRAVMNEAIFANVEVSGAGSASPIVRLSVREVVLEPIEPAVTLFSVILDLAIDALFASVERLHRAAAVVNDPEGAGESQLHGAVRDRLRIFRIANTSADDRVDIDGELSAVREVLEFLIEDLQTFQRHIVGLNVVDADLQMLESGFVQRDNFLGREQVSIRDHPRDHSVAADTRDDRLDFRMQQWLTAADRHDRRFEICQAVNPANHFIGWHRR